jgi:hypothetical protein
VADLKANAITLLSTTTVSFAGNGNTTLYTVPVGNRLVLDQVIIVAAADAGTTTVSVGQSTALTDFLPVNTLSNLDAQYDTVVLMPIPNTTPLKNKSYVSGTLIQIAVTNHAGSAGNSVYLYGTLI